MPSRRADARRSRAAILEAAVDLLNTDPDASLGAVASAAGVTRQTVYAHFASRDQLLLATVDKITEEAVAAMAAADAEAGPADEALLRVLDAGALTIERHPTLLQQASLVPVAAEADHDRHEPVADRIEAVVERGQRTGEFDDRLPTTWLVAATISLAHTASEEREAGRLSTEEAHRTLRVSLWRLLGVHRS